MICYAANTQGVFVINFFIYSDVLNYRRSVDTIVITTAPKSFSLRRSSLKAAVLYCFDVFPVRSLQKFQVQVKISTILSMFPDNLSYDHDKKVVLKNFSISTGKCLCWSLLKACRFIKKRLGNGWFYISSFRSG